MRNENTIGGRIAKRRIELGLTQAQVSEKTNITIPTLSNIEGDKRIPSIDTLIELVPILECSMDYILLGKNGTVPTKIKETNKENRILKAVAELIDLNVLFLRGTPDWDGNYTNDCYLDFCQNFPRNTVLKFAEQLEKLSSLKKTTKKINNQFSDLVNELINSNSESLKEELKKQGMREDEL